MISEIPSWSARSSWEQLRRRPREEKPKQTESQQKFSGQWPRAWPKKHPGKPPRRPSWHKGIPSLAGKYAVEKIGNNFALRRLGQKQEDSDIADLAVALAGPWGPKRLAGTWPQGSSTKKPAKQQWKIAIANATAWSSAQTCLEGCAAHNLDAWFFQELKIDSKEKAASANDWCKARGLRLLAGKA